VELPNSDGMELWNFLLGFCQKGIIDMARLLALE